MKIFFVHLLLLAFFFSCITQSDEIVGKWKFTDNSREIEIYREDNKYYGKIVKKSGENDKMKIGHIMLKNFIYDQSLKKYTGEINTPLGMAASAQLVLIDEKKLEVSLKKRKPFILEKIN